MAQDPVSEGIDLFDAQNPAAMELPQGKPKRRAKRRAAFFRHRGSDCADALRRPHFKDVRDPPLVIAAREAAMAEAAEDTIIVANDAAWRRSLSKLSLEEREYQEFLSALTERELEEFSATVMA